MWAVEVRDERIVHELLKRGAKIELEIGGKVWRTNYIDTVVFN